MTRLFRSILTLAITVAFLFAGSSAYANTSSTMTSSSHHMKHSCPAGQHWVKGYKTKSGKKVHGYCRK
ncbi:MAG TPA: hypothetical protein VKT72_17585 [Candidatus Baltobacteraceae bacterium]|nr:hypothetical protein [Candidatus Baltobacteraceae bacterium]